MNVASLAVRRFDAAKMQKLNLFETGRFFCDVYAVLEGSEVAQVAGEERELLPGEAVLAPADSDHWIVNRGGARAAVLVFMAPRP